jgi:DNA excision repair protein ERCC-3
MDIRFSNRSDDPDMTRDLTRPLIVQSDRTLLLETDNPYYEEARDALTQFAELVKSPEHVHTYRITPLSLWNAAAAGHDAEEIIAALAKFSKYELPQNLLSDIRDYVARYGRLRLRRHDNGQLVLESDDDLLTLEIQHQKNVQPYIQGQLDRRRLLIQPRSRGLLKQALIKIGYPVEDLAGYVEGAPLDIRLRETTGTGRPFRLRPYQLEAIAAFHAEGSVRGGSGVLVLPCGAGKTIIGIGIMEKVKSHTLIIGTSITAVRQWRDELLDKTSLDESEIGEYSGESKEIRPVTLATYQILTYRRSKDEDFVHFDLFDRQDWGLIIYDEVHLLPAPVFRAVADVQAKRRLGLTATLIREDGHEDDVFSLIGPKRYDVPWKVLERQGWIAEAVCHELRLPFASDSERMAYAVASPREKFRIASETETKLEVTRRLLEQHRDDHVLVIGQYLGQLEKIAEFVNAPLITGRTSNAERQRLYDLFRQGSLKVLVVSKVANFAIDLPEANVAIQVSGTFGSRQEEAQRLGRILRPKAAGTQAHFYSLVTRDTREQEFAAKRQLFLTEQGYRYEIEILS